LKKKGQRVMKMTIKKSRSLESVNRLDVGAKTKYHILLGNLFTLNHSQTYWKSCTCVFCGKKIQSTFPLPFSGMAVFYDWFSQILFRNVVKGAYVYECMLFLLWFMKIWNLSCTCVFCGKKIQSAFPLPFSGMAVFYDPHHSKQRFRSR
jgi:rRNA maturation protein Nop10